MLSHCGRLILCASTCISDNENDINSITLLAPDIWLHENLSQFVLTVRGDGASAASLAVDAAMLDDDCSMPAI